jgi:hypothetical protein
MRPLRLGLESPALRLGNRRRPAQGGDRRLDDCNSLGIAGRRRGLRGLLGPARNGKKQKAKQQSQSRKSHIAPSELDFRPTAKPVADLDPDKLKGLNAPIRTNILDKFRCNSPVRNLMSR